MEEERGLPSRRSGFVHVGGRLASRDGNARGKMLVGARDGVLTEKNDADESGIGPYMSRGRNQFVSALVVVFGGGL